MVLLKIAFRNILLHKVKTAVIGLIIVFGTVLAILGNSFVDAISSGMRTSLVSSVTGDLQIYSKDAPEKLSVFGTVHGDASDVGSVPDFSRVRDALLAKIPEIKDVVPMGFNTSFLNPGNLLDVKLEELRAMFKAGKNADPIRRAALKEHVQAIVKDTTRSYKANTAGDIFVSNDNFKDAPRNIERALAPAFWSDFDSRWDERIEFLANKMAPLIFDDTMLFFNYIGTDPQRFQRMFDQFEIVKGEMIPSGKRGFLFNDYIYETMAKNRVARRLDAINKKLTKERQTIAKEKTLRDQIDANVAGAAEVYAQLSPVDARRITPALQAELKSAKTDIQELIKDFLRMNDENFTQRYKFFYDVVAPNLILYRIGIGEVFPMTAYGKTGYARALNIRLFGTFRFKSFESSPIAGNFSLMDMVSFRQLYGFMTEELRAETRQLEKEMGASDFGREEVEGMFKKSEPSATREQQTSVPAVMPKNGGFNEAASEQEMSQGVFISAAVILKDPAKMKKILARIQEVSKADNLGIQASDWREAAGMVGQLTTVVRILLYSCVFITFMVAAFIIANSMLMATLDRSREIGTMRAIGAQRKFIATMLLNEAFLLSFIFGVIGTFIGVAIVGTIGRIGIPASGDVATFFFSGSRLYLSVNPVHIFIVFVAMTVIAVLATQYPAWRAMKISPLEAMHKAD
jgi:ABC-type lipoprotein release transport system permease subunit